MAGANDPLRPAMRALVCMMASDNPERYLHTADVRNNCQYQLPADADVAGAFRVEGANAQLLRNVRIEVGHLSWSLQPVGTAWVCPYTANSVGGVFCMGVPYKYIRLLWDNELGSVRISCEFWMLPDRDRMPVIRKAAVYTYRHAYDEHLMLELAYWPFRGGEKLRPITKAAGPRKARAEEAVHKGYS